MQYVQAQQGLIPDTSSDCQLLTFWNISKFFTGEFYLSSFVKQESEIQCQQVKYLEIFKSISNLVSSLKHQLC